MQTPVDGLVGMDGTFPGRIVLVEGDEVDVDLQIGAGKIRLATPFAEIGAWELAAVEFSGNETGGFDLTVADDVVTFFPTDVEAFDEAIEAAQAGGSYDVATTVDVLDESDLTDDDPAEAVSQPDQPEVADASDLMQSEAREVRENAAPLTDSEDLEELEPYNDDAVDQGVSEISDESDAIDVLDESGDVSPVEAEEIDQTSPAPIEELAAAVDELRAETIAEETPDASTEGDLNVREAQFAPSSRERLAAAMSGFRDRQKRKESAADEAESLADDAESAEESAGFVIPGDSGYAYPSDESDVIEFDEEVSDSTVADEVMASQRDLRDATSVRKLNPDKIRKFAIAGGIVAVLVVLGFLAPVVVGILRSDDTGQVTAPTTVPTTVPARPTVSNPTNDTAPDVTVDPFVNLDPVFDVAANEFTNRWNDVAASVSPSLRFRTSLPSGDFEAGFTNYIAVTGSVGLNGRLSQYTLEVDPLGPSDSDQLGMQALGVAVAVADPTLEPIERAELLRIMGLNVRNPLLGGIDGSVTRNGNTYALFYDSEAVKLTLTIQPG